MSQAHSSSLARVLAAPWQQRRNAGSLWGLAFIVAVCTAAPAGLWIWSLLAGPELAARLSYSAKGAAVAGIGALLAAGWAMLVANVLQQNHPALARLVPGHVGRLRSALIVAWAMGVLVAAGGPGFSLDAPWAWACGTGAGLALFAAGLRWPVLWVSGIVAPFLAAAFRHWDGQDAVAAPLQALWRSERPLATAVVLTAGVVVLTTMIRTGGTAHLAQFEARRRGHRAAHAGLFGRPARASAGCRGLFGTISGPYLAWMRHLLARPGSSVMARLLLGIGPATHWSTRVFEAFSFLALSGVLCLLAGIVAGGHLLALILPWFSFSVLTGVCTSSLQSVAKLSRTRREQALLVLLPGVPRGARLNRWLAWQMSLAFVVAALCGLALTWGLNALADAMVPGVVERATSGLTFAIGAALLPQVAWQWRRWAGLRGDSGAKQLAPTIAPFLLGAAVLALRAMTGIGWWTFGAALAAASLVYCAWRWRRMGREPSAFPVGRLA